MKEATTPRHLFLVLGATGDLMDRKLLPSLRSLHSCGEIPPGSVILGVARAAMTDQQFRERALGFLEKPGSAPDPGLVKWCSETLFYHSMGKAPPGDYQGLAARVAELEKTFGLPANRVLYLALPVDAVTPTLEGLAAVGLTRSGGWTRVVVEKPFGFDLISAEALNAGIHQHFDESKIFRIDHYLGKETVQNLLVLRFANMFIEALWQRHWVDHVQITVAENLGVEGRAGYYDASGALRDMVQNHLTQLLTLVAMEVPSSYEAAAIRNEKVKVLKSLERLEPEDVVLGQYEAGILDGQKVPGYREEDGIPPDSKTETFVALRLKIANWRWQGVPFFLRTGKRMARKSTRIVVTFRAPPVTFFTMGQDYEVNPDRLTITLQPDEGFDLSFEIKVPGEETKVQTHDMKFRYADVFGTMRDAYETLLLDVIRGDQTLFVGADEVEESWRIYDAVLRFGLPLRPYSAGTMGPPEAVQLVEELGHKWNDV